MLQEFGCLIAEIYLWCGLKTFFKQILLRKVVRQIGTWAGSIFLTPSIVLRKASCKSSSIFKRVIFFASNGIIKFLVAVCLLIVAANMMISGPRISYGLSVCLRSSNTLCVLVGAWLSGSHLILASTLLESIVILLPSHWISGATASTYLERGGGLC